MLSPVGEGLQPATVSLIQEGPVSATAGRDIQILPEVRCAFGVGKDLVSEVCKPLNPVVFVNTEIRSLLWILSLCPCPSFLPPLLQISTCWPSTWYISLTPLNLGMPHSLVYLFLVPSSFLPPVHSNQAYYTKANGEMTYWKGFSLPFRIL